ncbi:MAG: ribF [Phycisphaerales bacterium]|nr:ribF [Phycisphaerales bacterium]
MKIVEGLDGLRSAPPGGVLSVGNFDGLHRGHRRILEVGRQLRASTGGELIVVTFEPHPLTVLRPEKAPPRLTPATLKRELLAEAGVDLLVVVPPTKEVLDLSAEAFWAILRDEVRPRHMVEGGSFTFGKGRGGTVEKLREWSAGTAVSLRVIEAVEVALLDLTVAPVSSSLIRWLLGSGRVRDAAICLGRPYTLEGEVVKGYQRGRTIGVPTANLDCGGQMMVAEGVYAGRSTIDGETYPAAVSIGRMETFGDKLRQQVEAHLIGFDGDLYGRTIRVQLLDWGREQRKYDGLDALMEQIRRDLDWTVGRVGLEPAREIAQI